MIFSHSGGTMPFLIERYDFFDKSGQGKTGAPAGFRAEIAKFYFDIAQAANPVATSIALRAVVPTSQIVRSARTIPIARRSNTCRRSRPPKCSTPVNSPQSIGGTLTRSLGTLMA